MSVAAESCPVLALNADFRPLSYIPLSLWSWQEAIKAVVADRVEVVCEYDREIRSPSMAMRLPSVIALRGYLNVGQRAAFTRYNIFLRDHFRCAFCRQGLPAEKLTIDHVVPRSRGGYTEWDNVIAACASCNARKGSRMPNEVGMAMPHRPYEPSQQQLQAIARRFPPRFIHASWHQFLDFAHPVAAE